MLAPQMLGGCRSCFLHIIITTLIKKSIYVKQPEEKRGYLNRSTDIYEGMANAAPPKIQIALWIEKGVI